MYYILLPKEMVAKRHIFQDITPLPEPDGRTPVTLRDINYLSFSLGTVEVVNDTDLRKLRTSLNNKNKEE